MLCSCTMAEFNAGSSAARPNRSPSPRPVQKTPSWTVSQHEDVTSGPTTLNTLDVAYQEPTSLSPLDAYDNSSPQGSHFSAGAVSMFGSHSDLTTPGYNDDFLGDAIGPILALDDQDDPHSSLQTTTQNDPAPLRQGLAPEQRPIAENPSLDELEKQRALDATKSEVRDWLRATEPAAGLGAQDANRLHVSHPVGRQRARSTGDFGNSRKPTLLSTDANQEASFAAALSPEDYLNLDDDDDDEDEENNDSDDDDQDDTRGDSENNNLDDAEGDVDSDDVGGPDRRGRSSTPPARAEPFANPDYAASPPSMEQDDQDDSRNRGKPWTDPQFALPVRQISQPHSSNAAMAVFQQRARDIETASVSATIGSRRRSETDVSSLFSAAGISVKVPAAAAARVPDTANAQRARRPSLLSKVLPRRSSSNLKKRKDGDANPSPPADATHARQNSESSFSAPRRISSWGRSKSPHKIDMALARGPVRSPPLSGSTTFNTPTAWQSTKAAIRRGRSPSGSGGLADMLRQAGGPPVAHLPQTDDMPCPTPVPAASVPASDARRQQPLPPQVESRQHFTPDDDDNDGLVPMASAPVPTTATVAAFKDHILKLDAKGYTPHFMIDRLAQEQLRRYKRLADSHQRHSKAQKCSSGASCAKTNAAPKFLPPKGAPRAGDAAAVVFYIASHPLPQDDPAALNGSAVLATFPAGVPLPPVPKLPAEFECPLCFQVKKIYKPSDWTKHVHEDVQPFTCTFPNCAETKSFKRKADWVRHENERHRHLEKWECSIDACGHQCFRKNNFQEHLVREHKLPEIRERRPTATSMSTEAPESGAIKDLIESCHIETSKQPTDEPCRFCGERFPTWKKLHVHLAGHLLSISMPILEMSGLGDIRLPPPTSASVKQSQQVLSDNDASSQASFARNMSSSPSMTRSPVGPGGNRLDAALAGRQGSTYPPPGMDYSSNNNTLGQYQMPSQPLGQPSKAGYVQSSAMTQDPQDLHDSNQDPTFLTTPGHTYPPPGVLHHRSRSATRSPAESWLSPDYQHPNDVSTGNLNMQSALGITGQQPPRQYSQSQGIVYSQFAPGFPTPHSEASLYNSSSAYQSPNSQMGFNDFSTPVSMPHSQSQSRLVSPTPPQQHSSVHGSMQSMTQVSYGGPPTTNGMHASSAPYASVSAATYPARTTTADDIAANINIVRRQLAINQQDQQPQVIRRRPLPSQQGLDQQQAIPRRPVPSQQGLAQQQQQQPQSHQFYAEPLEDDFSVEFEQQDGNSNWLDQMYTQQPTASQAQQQHQQYMATQPSQQAQQQIPYTSAPRTW